MEFEDMEDPELLEKDQEAEEEGAELLDDLADDTEAIDAEAGEWEGIDPCSLGNAVLFELDKDGNPDVALERALGNLKEDSSYFIQPSFSDYDEIQSLDMSGEVDSGRPDEPDEDVAPDSVPSEESGGSLSPMASASPSMPTRRSTLRPARSSSGCSGRTGWRTLRATSASSGCRHRKPATT